MTLFYGNVVSAGAVVVSDVSRAVCCVISVVAVLLMQTGWAVAQMPTAAQAPSNTQPLRGVVRAVHQAALSTELATPVALIGAREGQRFKAGERLIEFDCRRQKHELAALAASVREAQVVHDSNAYLQRSGASNRNDVAVAAARLEKSQAEFAALKQRLVGCLIAAPFDGVVVELGVNAHELPPANKPVMVIASDQDLEIEVIVPSRDLVRLGIGVRFDFVIDETQRSYVAHVLRAGGTVDPMSQTTKVFGVFRGPFDGVSPGMSGTAHVHMVEGR
jgi:membrane fusion protein, multidrug efflux system